MIIIFGRIMMNGIDTKFIKIASSYTKKAKIINICGIKDIKFSSKKTLTLGMMNRLQRFINLPWA